jgi:hypothetical protein
VEVGHSKLLVDVDYLVPPLGTTQPPVGTQKNSATGFIACVGQGVIATQLQPSA